MRVKITIDGEVSEVNVDIDVATFSMREMVRLEEVLGPEATDALMEGRLRVRPSMLQALLYAKLKTRFPTLTIDDFDIDGAEIAAQAQSAQEAEVVPLPMTLADGTELVGEATREAVGEL